MNVRRHHFLRWCTALIAVGFAAACTTQADHGLNGPERAANDAVRAEPLPTIAELLATRVPLDPTMPPQLTGSRANQALARGEPIGTDVEGSDAELSRCLRADARRDYPGIAEHCATYAGLCDEKTCHRAAPGNDERAPITIAMLTRHLGSFDDVTRRRLASLSEIAVGRCRATQGRCAELVFAVALLRQGLDDVLRDPEIHRLRADDDATLWAQHAVVDGPWQDAEAHFVDGPRRAGPMQRHPRFRTRPLVASAGRLQPAQDAQPGWYRLTIAGESAAGPATLCVTGHGAAEIRVDGVVVLVRHSGEGGAATEAVPLLLSSGGHEVEVLFIDRGGGLALAVVDDAGRSALITSAERRWRRPAGVSLASSASTFTLPSIMDRGDVDLMQRVLVRHIAGRLGFGVDRLELQHLTTVLARQWGWSAPAVTSAALSVESDILPEQVLRALAAPLWDHVSTVWPEAPLPLLFRARMARDDEPEAALVLYRALVRAAPAYPIGRRELIAELTRQGLVDEAIEVARGLLALGRTAENLDAAVVAWRAAGALEQVARINDEQLERAGPAQRVHRRLQRGDTEGVLADMTAMHGRTGLLHDDMQTEDAFLDLAEVHRPALATAMLARRRTTRTDDVELALREARAQSDLESVRRITRHSAHLPAVLLGIAWGERAPWTDALVAGDRLVAERLHSPPPFPDAGGVTLRQNIERHFAEDGSSLTIRHFIFEVRNKESIDSVGELSLDSDDLVVRLRVVKPDGRMLEPEHHDEVRDISLTGLAPGDIVEWLIVAVDDGARDGAFWETSSFASASPRLERCYVTSWPVSLESTRHIVSISTHGAPAGVRRRIGDRIELRFEAQNLPALLDEPHAAHRLDDEPQVGIAIDVDDDVVLMLRAPQVQGAFVRDRWLQEMAIRLAGQGTARERLSRLFTLVANRVVEANTADAPSTLATGRGQRLLLLAALARAAGLNAGLAAVHGRLEPTLELPSMRAFPELVLRVDVGHHSSSDDVVFVMSSERGMLMDALPPRLLNASVVDLDSGARTKMPAASIDDRPLELIVDLRLTPDAFPERFDGTVTVRLPAFVAEAMRPAIRAAPADQLTRFVERVVSETLPGVKATRVVTTQLDSAGVSLDLHADIEVPRSSATSIRFDHLFSSGAGAALGTVPPLGSYTRVAERQRTLVVMPHHERVEVTWRVPAGVRLVEAPPSLTLQAGPFSLRQDTRIDDGRVLWVRTLRSEGARVPTKDWPTVRAALATLTTAADAQLAFDVAVAPP